VLRVAGATVVAHDECFEPDTPDEDWLAEAGRRGWIVLDARPAHSVPSD
jgi:hypothetical protein